MIECYLNLQTAIRVIKEVNSPHIRLLLDIYHLQHIQGNITRTMEEMMPYVGHIQIAQAPHRNEPNTPGEINYKYVLDAIYPAGEHLVLSSTKSLTVRPAESCQYIVPL